MCRMAQDKVIFLERLFLALSDRTRLKLLSLMSKEECSVGYLVERLNQSQPKISRHLAYLRQSGVVSTRRDGKSIFYSIDHSLDPSSMAVLRCTMDAINGPGHCAPVELPQFEIHGGHDAADQYENPVSDELDVFLL